MKGSIPAMDATTARTLNMRRIVQREGGPTTFANRYGAGRWQQAQVSQWISQTRPKPIGGPLARALEAELGMSRGALDQWEGDAGSVESQPTGLDLPRLHLAQKFLEDLFEAEDKVFVSSQQTTMLSRVYDDLSRASAPNWVEMTARYGRLIRGSEDERERAVGSVGKDDLSGAGARPRKAKVAAHKTR